MYHSPIIRMTAGPINAINDAAIGQIEAGPGPSTSKFQGQLGNGIWLDDANILYDSSIGVVYGGHFRYVRLKSTAGAVARGQIVFWDPTVAPNLYQVTDSEADTTDGAVLAAGLVLNPSWSAGYYSVIQDVGLVATKFRAALTDAGAIGSPVYCAAAGAGADNGLADVLNDANPTTFGDVSLLQRRFLGTAKEAPTSGGTKLVYVNIPPRSL
jgi:hypothetical protein